VRITQFFRKVVRVAIRLSRESKAGGQEVYREELEELRERQATIPVPHATLKTAFRISHTVEDSPYDSENDPFELISTITRLSPPDVLAIISGESSGPLGDGEASTTIYVPWVSRLTKSYEFTPHISGSKFLKGTSVASNAAKGAFAGFSYYDRHLVNRCDGGRAAKLAGGIATPFPQFAAIIHDGYEISEIPVRDHAGFETARRPEVLKRPIRICILGEVSDHGDTLNIRRMIIDGESFKITRENVALGLDYAANLVIQIFEGKTYDPAAAMQKALTSQPRAPGSIPRPATLAV
jgi:hypothetical protein